MKQVGKAAAPEDKKRDEELVTLVLAGQREVFTELYHRYYSRTYRLAYGMTGYAAAAEDLAQEVFLRAYQKLGQFGGQSSFSTWFYRLTVNCCLNYRQREISLVNSIDEIEAMPAAGEMKKVEANILQKQIQQQIQQALLTLKPKFRVIVILKDIEGLSYEEIAERINCSTGTIASRLNRARALLARKLEHLRGAV